MQTGTLRSDGQPDLINARRLNAATSLPKVPGPSRSNSVLRQRRPAPLMRLKCVLCFPRCLSKMPVPQQSQQQSPQPTAHSPP